MKKTIIKTAIITFVSVILFIVLLFGAFALWCPKIIGNVASAFNNYGGTIWGYEKQYNQYGDFSDLQFLVYTLNDSTDAQKTATYSQKMIDSSSFDSYCESKDKTKTPNQMTEREYVYRKCVIALVNIGDFSKAMEKANEYYQEKGYTLFNPYRAIVANCNKLTKEQAQILKDKLESLPQTQEVATRVSEDISILDNYINK